MPQNFSIPPGKAEAYTEEVLEFLRQRHHLFPEVSADRNHPFRTADFEETYKSELRETIKNLLYYDHIRKSPRPS